MSLRYAIHKFDNKQIDRIIKDGFKKFGIDKRLKNAKLVLIKPNLVSDVREYINNGSNSDIRVIEGIIKYLSHFNVHIVIAESDTGTKTKGRKLELALKHMGVLSLKSKYDFEIINLSKDKQVLVKFKNGLILNKIHMGKTSLDADLIINIPKLKTHKYATITCALKNMFGCIPDPLRVVYHHNIHKTLADLNTLFINKTFVVLDGIRAMEGQGPIYGTPIDMNIICFADDMLVNDYVAAKIMGFDPYKVPHIVYFWKRYHNIKFKQIRSRGELEIDSVKKSFIPSRKNWFIKIEEQLMRNRFMVKIIFNEFIQKNITYHFRHTFKKWRGGSYSWYIKEKTDKNIKK